MAAPKRKSEQFKEERNLQGTTHEQPTEAPQRNHEVTTEDPQKHHKQPTREALTKYHVRFNPDDWQWLKEHFEGKGLTVSAGLRMIAREYQQREKR